MTIQSSARALAITLLLILVLFFAAFLFVLKPQIDRAQSGQRPIYATRYDIPN
jgi:preprotein translocase subunit YajC